MSSETINHPLRIFLGNNKAWSAPAIGLCHQIADSIRMLVYIRDSDRHDPLLIESRYYFPDDSRYGIETGVHACLEEAENQFHLLNSRKD